MRGGRLQIPLSLLLVAAVALVGCGDDDDDTEAATDTEQEDTEENDKVSDDSGTVDPASIKTDFGADDKTIRIGLLTDLTGPFSGLVKDAVVAQQVFWDKVNKAGGIGGRQIKLVIDDTKYDLPTFKTKFQAMKVRDASGVLMLGQSTGSPHTASIKADLETENIIAIPVSFYSGWADPAFGKNVFESYTNYCFEAMNLLEWIQKEQGAKKIAIVTFPGEAGLDAANGAKLGAEALGLEVVYDGAGQVSPPTATNPNPDVSGVVNSIVSSKADFVVILVNPGALGQIMGGAAAKGYAGKWAGLFPTYHPSLLKSDVKQVIDSSFFGSSYTVALGTDVPGMQEMIDAIKAAKPDALASESYTFGWTEAQTTEAILRAAASAGDLTRAGVVKAAFGLDKVDFRGLAPPQSWKGEPDDYIVRESYIFKPKVGLYKEGPLGEGNTGAEILDGPITSKAAQDYDYAANGACFKAAG